MIYSLFNVVILSYLINLVVPVSAFAVTPKKAAKAVSSVPLDGRTGALVPYVPPQAPRGEAVAPPASHRDEGTLVPAPVGVPSADDYVRTYSTQLGYIPGTGHGDARSALRTLFGDTLSGPYRGDLLAFYLSTHHQLEQRYAGRSRIAALGRDRFRVSRTLLCEQVLSEFTQEQATRRREAAEHGGELLTLDPGVLDSALNGLGAVISAHDRSAAQHGHIPAIVTNTLFAAATTLALHFYGPAYLMVGAQQIFPLLYARFIGAVPAIGTAAYYTGYLPMQMNFMGYVFTHAKPVLTALGVASSVVPSLARGALAGGCLTVRAVGVVGGCAIRGAIAFAGAAGGLIPGRDVFARLLVRAPAAPLLLTDSPAATGDPCTAVLPPSPLDNGAGGKKTLDTTVRTAAEMAECGEPLDVEVGPEGVQTPLSRHQDRAEPVDGAGPARRDSRTHPHE